MVARRRGCGMWMWSVLCVPEDACWNVATAAYGDHEVGFEVIEDALCA